MIAANARVAAMLLLMPCITSCGGSPTNVESQLPESTARALCITALSGLPEYPGAIVTNVPGEPITGGWSFVWGLGNGLLLHGRSRVKESSAVCDVVDGKIVGLTLDGRTIEQSH